MISEAKRPLTTVVIPTYNRRKMVSTAISSCLEQTVPVELIVVDHGSTDGTASYLKEVFPELLVIRRPFDSGPHLAWLDGVSAASTNLVKLLYDDDYLRPTYIEKLEPFFDDPDVGMAFTAAYIESLAEGSSHFQDWSLHLSRGIHYSGANFLRLAPKVISPSAVLFRREVLIDAIYTNRLPFQSLQHKGVGPDHYAKNLAFLRFPRFAYVPEGLVYFGAHDGSLTIEAKREDGKRKLDNVYDQITTFSVFLWLSKSIGLFRVAQSVVAASRACNKLGRWIRGLVEKTVLLMKLIFSRVSEVMFKVLCRR